MNYYLDTEFIEDFYKPLSGRCHHYIDLISIGLVTEDDREYYAVSKDFDLKHVWNKYDTTWSGQLGEEPSKVYWLRENVLRPIHKSLYSQISGDMKNTDYFHDLSEFTYKNLKRLIWIFGKTNQEIAVEIQKFTTVFKEIETDKPKEFVIDTVVQRDQPVFYGYYADYDWVLFCSLFGRMLDLPRGYPMYCRDLKQIMDELNLTKQWKDDNVPGDNEHHALEDARWNRRLHKTIETHIACQPIRISL